MDTDHRDDLASAPVRTMVISSPLVSAPGSAGRPLPFEEERHLLQVAANELRCPVILDPDDVPASTTGYARHPGGPRERGLASRRAAIAAQGLHPRAGGPQRTCTPIRLLAHFTGSIVFSDMSLAGVFKLPPRRIVTILFTSSSEKSPESWPWDPIRSRIVAI